MRRRGPLGGLAFAGAVLGTSLLLGTSASATGKSGIPAKVRAELLKIALSSAAKGGDRHPYDIQAVRAPDNVKFTPPKAPGRENWVYFIAMHGQFRRCPKDKGGPGTGRFGALAMDPAQDASQKCEDVLEITVLASTLEPLFLSYTCDYPDLKSHGTPVRLGAAIKAPASASPGRRCVAPPNAEEIP